VLHYTFARVCCWQAHTFPSHLPLTASCPNKSKYTGVYTLMQPPYRWVLRTYYRLMTRCGPRGSRPSYLPSFSELAPPPRWPTPWPKSSEHLFWASLARTLHQIHAPPQGLLSAQSLPLSSVASIHPQIAEARKSRLCSMQERLDPLSKSMILALCGPSLGVRNPRGVHQDVVLRMPLTFLPPSQARRCPPTTLLFELP
jgi:hypothetical protein